jgi:hypothetical protein
MRRLTCAAVLSSLALAVALTGCAPHPAAPTPHATATGPNAATTRCAIGTWTLNLSDFSQQNMAWLADLGLPISTFVTTGDATLTMTASHLSLKNHTTTSAVVDGHSYIESVNSTGGSDWSWSDDEPGTLLLAGWSWGESPSPLDPGAPPQHTFFDPTPGSKVEVVCDGPIMSLHGPDSSITGNFDRR